MVGYSIDMQLSLYEGEEVPLDEIVMELDEVDDDTLAAELESLRDLPGQLNIFDDLDY